MIMMIITMTIILMMIIIIIIIITILVFHVPESSIDISTKVGEIRYFKTDNREREFT
jgi:hypothetical protein